MRPVPFQASNLWLSLIRISPGTTNICFGHTSFRSIRPVITHPVRFDSSVNEASGLVSFQRRQSGLAIKTGGVDLVAVSKMVQKCLQ
jgi:hypothetical protein